MADVFGNAITGENKWRYRSATKKPDMYQVEHDEMFAAIRAGKPINNGEHAAHSTLLALMGRTAAYTGQVVTPDYILNSKEDLSPPKYEFGPLVAPAIPVPGFTTSRDSTPHTAVAGSRGPGARRRRCQGSHVRQSLRTRLAARLRRDIVVPSPP